MNETMFEFFSITITPWKLIGYLGVFMFSARWFIQLWFSKRRGKVVMPSLFWYMSMVGSLLCLLYFVFGKNDSVGILAYLFPTGVSAYNLYLHYSHKERKKLAKLQKQAETAETSTEQQEKSAQPADNPPQPAAAE